MMRSVCVCCSCDVDQRVSHQVLGNPTSLDKGYSISDTARAKGHPRGRRRGGKAGPARRKERIGTKRGPRGARRRQGLASEGWQREGDEQGERFPEGVLLRPTLLLPRLLLLLRPGLGPRRGLGRRLLLRLVRVPRPLPTTTTTTLITTLLALLLFTSCMPMSASCSLQYGTPVGSCVPPHT